MLAPWKESYDQPRQYIKKQRHYNPKKSTPRHITIKMKEVKDKACITRATRGKQLVTKRKLPEESQLTFQGNTASQKGWICYILYRRKIYKQEYPTWQGYYSDLKKR